MMSPNANDAEPASPAGRAEAREWGDCGGDLEAPAVK
jgi:hypothetical protein